MERRRTSRRRAYHHRKPFAQRAKDSCRKFTAFMFSNVGIIILVVLYTIAGAFMFIAIEGGQEIERLKLIESKRKALAEKLWEISCCEVNIFNETVFYDLVKTEILTYQKMLVEEFRDGWIGSDTKIPGTEKQWTFSAGFLYSLTVITTIGYGNVSPKSDWGKVVTIFYAIIGMPLFLLYLSNIGDILAKSFKWIYAKLCLCRVCPGVARRRALRERKKTGDLSVPYDSNWTEFQIENLDYENNWNDDNLESVEDDDDDDDESLEFNDSTETVTVPITVCLMIMTSYILFGAALFSSWESWNYLDGSYFCFISLSSIGFGDIVPGFKLVGDDFTKVDLSSAFCAIYLLLGMALIAMCFNLMQEQVIHKMRSAKKLIRRCFRCDR